MVQVPAVPAAGDQVPTAEEDIAEDSESSVLPVEIKIDSALAAEMQLTAQSIVFSFLQNKYNKDRMKSRLVPALSFTLKNYQIICYDSEKDILMSTVADSPYTKLFDDTIKSLNFSSVVVLWMTLNYRLLCSGVPTKSKIIKLPNVKAEFYEKVGDHLKLYEEEVQRPAHVPCKKSSDAPEGQGKSMLQMFGDYEINTGFSPLPLQD